MSFIRHIANVHLGFVNLMSIRSNQPRREIPQTSRPRFLGETLSQEPGESFGWHSHDFGQLISAASGSMYVGTLNRVLLLSPAMVIWIPPDVEHWLQYGSENEMLYVDVSRDEAKMLGLECRVIATTPLLRALFSATMPKITCDRSDSHQNALQDLLRHELTAAIEVPLSVAMPDDKRIRGFAQAALDSPGEITSVKTWLSNAAASRKTIERLFVAETGLPPSRWLRHVRILHAVSLLAAGAKVSSVSFDMGYESASAFSYMFRRTIGISPSNFVQKS